MRDAPKRLDRLVPVGKHHVIEKSRGLSYVTQYAAVCNEQTVSCSLVLAR